MRVLRCHYPRITNRFLVYRLAGTFNMSRLYFLVLVFLLENSRENSNCEKRCHYWRNAMTKYTSEHYQRLFQHHAAHGGRLAKKELTSSEYRAFRRLFDGNTGLTAPRISRKFRIIISEIPDCKKKTCSRQAGDEQLSTTEALRLLRATTKTVKGNEVQFSAPSKRPNVVQKAARSFFADVAAADPDLRLRWSPYGLFLSRPEEIPHGARYFRKLEATNPNTAAAVRNLYKAVRKATH